MFSFSSVTGPPPNPQRVGVFAEGNAPVIGRLQNPTAELTFGLLADKASRRFGSGVAALLGAGRLLQAGGVLIIFEGPGEPQIVIMPSGRRSRLGMLASPLVIIRSLFLQAPLAARTILLC
ncbi:hypothetical protein EYR40_002997 [Pleurotus pulmonarius]|nr:hypothetical protein EYR36_005446 [Pleurotus pulmonarius]KAF4580245.1 hypothetical protein EYR40_003227 [Pleurotus pulmonarius]KAF4580599.1 hypothetical protein EYR40_002997 [Pleurotus pulmonarius]